MSYWQNTHLVPQYKSDSYYNDIYYYDTKSITLCPPGYHHNGFITTPELGHSNAVWVNAHLYLGTYWEVIKCHWGNIVK